MIQLVFTVNKDNRLNLQAIDSKGIAIDQVSLTLDRGFDTLLIEAIDKISVSNRIDRLRFCRVRIMGKSRFPGSVPYMVLESIKLGLES